MMSRVFHIMVIILAVCILPSCEKKEYEDKETVVGYSSSARKDPYLAAAKYLGDQGYEVDSRSGGFSDGGGERVIFLPLSSIRSIAGARRVIEWVNSGGHLICFLERGEDTWVDVGSFRRENDDFIFYQDSLNERSADAQLWFFDQFNVSIDTQDTNDNVYVESVKKSVKRIYEVPDATSLNVVINEKKFAARIAGGSVMSYGGDEVNVYTDDQELHKFLSVPHASGRVTFISDAQLFRNAFIGSQQHSQLLEELLSHEHTDDSHYFGNGVLFSLGKVTGFWELVWKNGKYPFIALLVLLVLWIWKNFLRFGPKLELIQTSPRGYLSHVTAHGEFLWRNKLDIELLKPLQRRIMANGGFPQPVASATSDYAIIPQEHITKVAGMLSSVSSFSEQHIRETLEVNSIKDPLHYIKTIQTLQQLIKLQS